MTLMTVFLGLLVFALIWCCAELASLQKEVKGIRLCVERQEELIEQLLEDKYPTDLE